MPAYLARTGLAVFAIVFAITFLTEHIADGRALVAVASAMDAVELPQLNETALTRIARSDLAVAGLESAPAVIASAPAPAAAARPVPVAPDAIVLASWYGRASTGTRPPAGRGSRRRSWAWPSSPCRAGPR